MLQGLPAGSGASGERQAQARASQTAAGASAQQSSQTPPRATQAQQPSQQKPQPPDPQAPTTGDSTDQRDLFNVARLRADLERKSMITLVVPDPSMPTFKVEVEGKRWQLPDLQTRLERAIPKMAVQVPFGGTTSADMTRLNTPPQFMGSSGFTNLEVLSMAAAAGETWLGKTAIKKVLEARHEAQIAQAREQIRQELAAIDEHNARVAAGQADDGSDAKKADKKKQDEEKKKQDAKKKKIKK